MNSQKTMNAGAMNARQTKTLFSEAFAERFSSKHFLLFSATANGSKTSTRIALENSDPFHPHNFDEKQKLAAKCPFGWDRLASNRAVLLFFSH